MLLLFVNHIFDDVKLLNASYSWVPNMPAIEATRDSKPVTMRQSDLDPYDPAGPSVWTCSGLKVAPLLKRIIRC